MSSVMQHSESSDSTSSRLSQLAAGEITWAEAEGMTSEDARAIAQVGCDLADAGRLNEARIIFQGLVVGNPHDCGARAALGTVLQKLGQEVAAMAEYDQVIKVAATNAIALANRGELRLSKGDRKAGLLDLQRAVAADPKGETFAARRAKKLLAVLELPKDAQSTQIASPRRKSTRAGSTKPTSAQPRSTQSESTKPTSMSMHAESTNLLSMRQKSMQFSHTG